MTKRLLLSTLFNEPRPIRYDWLAEVGKVPGKSLHLGIALAWMAVVRGGPRVRLGRRVMARFSLSRDACYDGLRRLEAHGLITVWRLPGRSPMVTLMEPRSDGKILRI
ncbi:MAG: hypothetical protein M0R47_06875 [Methylobacter sp.]|jgi:hypothetical protein|uniref:hypothetical protein n=1 Tax=Methylobacter sp. TaxID=2051955 RepID=UPI0025EC6D30|nr:hypothetical protein [Methylobacter sp.]MCK9620245.1 hypothetical protein [Methylobacter sp.]